MQNKKKILVIAESIDVEDSSGSKANVALILNLRDIGCNVTVFHYTRKEILLDGIETVAIKEKRRNPIFLLSRIQRRIQNGLKINLSKYLESLFGFSFTYFNDVRSIVKALKSEVQENYDLVLTLSKGASFRPHYALLRLPEFHHIWMAYIHDPYPFYYYPEPFKWKEPGVQRRIAFFKAVSEQCKWAAFPSLMLKQWMEGFFPLFKEKSAIIPHQLRTERLNVKLPPFFPEGKFVLLHAGNLFSQRPSIPLIKAFKRFLERIPGAREKCRLILVGGTSDHSEEMMKYEKQIDQFYFHRNYVQYSDVLVMQSKASVNIILESIAAESPFLPGKFPHCIAAGKPILLLGPKKSEALRLLGQDYPYWSETGDVEKISEIIEKLYLKWKSQGELTLNRKDIEFYLSKENLSITLEQLRKGKCKSENIS